MDENKIEQEQEQPVENKKAYTSPTLTMYGKLTELTAGGSIGNSENNPTQLNRRV